MVYNLDFSEIELWFQLAGSNWAFWLLLIVMFFDILSGFALSLKEGKTDSSIAFKGWCKHITVVMMSGILEIFGYALHQPIIGVMGCLIIMVSAYFVSLRTNLHLLGIDAPEWLENWLKSEIEKKINK